jgi:hypothetical protein
MTYSMRNPSEWRTRYKNVCQSCSRQFNKEEKFHVMAYYNKEYDDLIFQYWCNTCVLKNKP